MQRHQVRNTHHPRSREVSANNEEPYDTDDEDDLLGDEDPSPSSNVVLDDDYAEDFEEDRDEDGDLMARARSVEYDDTERLSSKPADDMADDEGVLDRDASFDAPEKEDPSEGNEGLDEKSEEDVSKEITIIEGIIEESRARCIESLGDSLFQYASFLPRNFCQR